jgi:hypothetical protein
LTTRHPLSAKVGTNFADKGGRSVGIVRVCGLKQRSLDIRLTSLGIDWTSGSEIDAGALGSVSEICCGPVHGPNFKYSMLSKSYQLQLSTVLNVCMYSLNPVVHIQNIVKFCSCFTENTVRLHCKEVND